MQHKCACSHNIALYNATVSVLLVKHRSEAINHSGLNARSVIAHQYVIPEILLPGYFSR